MAGGFVILLVVGGALLFLTAGPGPAIVGVVVIVGGIALFGALYWGLAALGRWAQGGDE